MKVTQYRFRRFPNVVALCRGADSKRFPLCGTWFSGLLPLQWEMVGVDWSSAISGPLTSLTMFPIVSEVIW